MERVRLLLAPEETEQMRLAMELVAVAVDQLLAVAVAAMAAMAHPA